HRSEDLFLLNPHARFNVRKYRGLMIVAAPPFAALEAFAAIRDARALVASDCHIAADHVELPPRYHGPHLRRGVHRIADANRSRARCQLIQHAFVDTALYQQARPLYAGLTAGNE